jgi:anti-sigma regulatory factor (Ser/Thr protein kinase)
MDQQGKQNLQAQIEIRIKAAPELLCVVRAAVKRAAEITGMRGKDIDSVILALEEAMTNVVRHSYGGPSEKPIEVKCNRIAPDGDTPAALEIIVRDFGRQVSPDAIRSRDLDDIRPGGLGVHIINSVMDHAEYSCPLDGGMQLKMIKYIPSREEHQKIKNEQQGV